MENNQVLVEKLSVIERIKAERDEYLAEYIKVRKANMGACGLGMLKDFKCKDCEAEFNAIPTDAKYCPSCLSGDIRIKSQDEIQVSWRIYQKINDEIKAEILELRSQNLSKKAIADKLGIDITYVSDIVGIKKRELPQEKIDYIRREYLSGRSESAIKWDLGRISEERIGDVTGDLCQEIKKAYDEGIRPEDIGKTIGIEGHDQAILEIVNRFIKLGYSRPLTQSIEGWKGLAPIF